MIFFYMRELTFDRITDAFSMFVSISYFLRRCDVRSSDPPHGGYITIVFICL